MIATVATTAAAGTSQFPVAGMETFEEKNSLLPADTQFVVIEGGNHAQFGSYGPQAGDKSATISAEDQWNQIAAATVAFLDELAK